MGTPFHVYIFLVIGLIAASQSGNIIRIGDAHPVAIAAWRLIIATCLLLPLSWKHLPLLAKLTRLELALTIAAGATLAVHFFLWIFAIQNAPVANAAVFFAINPVFTATAGLIFFKETISKNLLIAILFGLLGCVVIGVGELSFSPQYLLGDIAALGCSLGFTAYFLLGKRIRKALPTGVYVTTIYGTAAAVSFVLLFALDLPVVSYSGRNWLCFVLMALVPTMIGHTSFNHAVHYIDAGRISATTLTEPALAGIVAFFAWGEHISVQVALGYTLISASVLFLVSDSFVLLRVRKRS